MEFLQSNVTMEKINSVILSGKNGITGNSNGLYYTKILENTGSKTTLLLDLLDMYIC